MFKSSIETLRRYCATRLPMGQLLPLAGFLVAAGLVSGRPLGATALTLSLVLAVTLFLQFRLFDDLADLARDRREHPDRVLVQATSLRSFHLLLLVTFLANLLLILVQSGPPQGVAVFLLLNAGACLWYGALRRQLGGAVLGYHVVLAKYPVFVYLLSGTGPDQGQLGLAAAAVYLSFAIYEAVHDRSLHASLAAGRVLAIEIFLWGCVSAWMSVALLGQDSVFALIQAVLGVCGGLALIEIFGRRRVHLRSARANYLVFAIAWVQILTFTVGGRL